MNLGDSSLREICELMASDRPVPGGGSASAIAGALAASLVEMTARISLRRAETPLAREFQAIVGRAADIRARMLELSTLDAVGYDSVIAARRLPKETLDEVDVRAAAIKAAARGAATVPLETACLGQELAGLASTMIEQGNPNARSDGEVGRALALVARVGGIANVTANLPDMDPVERDRFQEKIASCRDE